MYNKGNSQLPSIVQLVTANSKLWGGLRLLTMHLLLMGKGVPTHVLFCIVIQIAMSNYAANLDFRPLSNEVILTSLSPGHRSSSVNVQIMDDTLVEQNEIFLIMLTSSAPGVLIEASNLTVTIIDNDGKYMIKSK